MNSYWTILRAMRKGGVCSFKLLEMQMYIIVYFTPKSVILHTKWPMHVWCATTLGQCREVSEQTAHSQLTQIHSYS